MIGLRAGIKIFAFAAYTVPLMPLQWLLLKMAPRLAKQLPRLYHRGLCRLLGVEVVRHGQVAGAGPILLVSNHTSWLDIPVLSALAPIAFIAKQEVADWPFLGTLARLQRTVFIERRSSSTARHRDAIGDRLVQGDCLVLFAEGTSNDGNRVLPFKSGFFAVAERDMAGRPLPVQPVSLAYTHLDGMPLGRRFAITTPGMAT